MQKQTKIKMNYIDRPKLGGGAPTAFKLWGQAAPIAPRFPRPFDRMSLNLLTTSPKKRIEMQIICSGVDGIKVQLWEAITLYRTRISENGLPSIGLTLGHAGNFVAP